MSKNKIQQMLVDHLLKNGQIELILPDNVVLEIGVTQENLSGNLVKKDDYCWVIASHKDRQASIDSYNLGLRFADEKNTILMDDRFTDDNGEHVRRVDVI